MNEGEATRTLDEMLDAVGAFQRRELLVALLDHNPQADAPVAVAGSDADPDATEQRIRMDHVHLPKLDEYGFIEWDRERHRVEKGPHFEEIRPLLELLADHADEFSDRRPRR